MQTITTLNNRRSSRSASGRRRRCAAQVARFPRIVPRIVPHLAQRRPVSAAYRALASLSAALAPVALAGLFLMTGALSGAPQAQAHAATLSSPSSPSLAHAAVDLAALSDMQAQARTSFALRYQRGYSVQGGWLCYGWPSGAYHCTQHWYRASSGVYVSRNPGWVPSQGSQASSGGSAAVTVTSFAAALSATPQGISQWASTGRASYPEPMGTYQGYTWGWCTSGAAMLTSMNLRGLGNADQWARNAAARGQPTGTTPRVGATVVYAPGVQGASSGGHVAHVAAVYANGWFMSEDVNFFWNGGGWGRVSFRYAHSGAGVTFIYG